MKIKARILLFVMLLNLLPIFGFASTDVPFVEVSGNCVTVKADVTKGEMTTFLVTDSADMSSRKYIGQNTFTDGKAVFTAELPRGSYDAHIVTAKEKRSVNFKIYHDVTIANENVKITGNTEKNSNITITVMDENKGIKYVDQTQADSNGEYSFNFYLKAGSYRAYIKSSSEKSGHEILFNITASDKKYKLMPEDKSTSNLYDAEFSMEFEAPVKIADKNTAQITIDAKKADGNKDENYPKTFNDVFKIASDNPKKVIIDLSKEGERLDVDRIYTVKLYDDAILSENGDAINLSFSEWTFDTKWTGYRPGRTGLQFIFTDFLKENCFVGLHAGQSYRIDCKSPPDFDFKKKHYPINYRAYYSDLVEVDRNGVLKAKEDVQGTGFLEITADNMEGKATCRFEIKKNFKRKLAVEKEISINSVIEEFFVADDGSVYFKTLIGNDNVVLSYDKDFNKREDFCYKLKTGEGPGGGREKLEGIVKINGREYLKISYKGYDNNDYTNLVDIQAGEIYKYHIPLLSKQCGENSSKFIVLGSSAIRIIRMYDVEKNEYVGGKHNTECYYTSINVFSNKIYVLDKGCVIVLNDSSEEIKRLNVESDGINCELIVSSDGSLYILNCYTGVIIKIDSDGKEIWRNTDYCKTSSDLYESSDGFLYVGVEKKPKDGEEHGNIELVKLNKMTGKKEKSQGIFFRSEREKVNYLGEYNSNIYTSSLILDKDGNSISYSDLTQQKNKEVNDEYIYLKNGYIYRKLDNVEMKSGNEFKIEKAKLMDEYVQVPTALDLKDSIFVRENSSSLIAATVLDQFGFAIEKEIYFSVEKNDVISIDKNMLKVNSLKDGKDKQEITVYANVADTNISKSFNVVVRQNPVPENIYIIDSFKGNTMSKNNEIDELNINTRSNGSFNIFVADQYGEFMILQPTEFNVEDSNIAGTRLYVGNSGSSNGAGQINYTCIVDPKAIGETNITVSLKEHPEIKDSIRIKVEDVNYKILWERGTDGEWCSKKSYHVSGIYDDFIYSNENNLVSLKNINGGVNWKSDVGYYYGMEISAPYVDDEGIVYVYDLMSTSVAALDSKDGTKLWKKFYGHDKIVNFSVKGKYIFVLTDKGILIKIDKNGNKTWETKISNELCVKDMEVSPLGIAYVTSDNNLYAVAYDGSKQELLVSAEGDRLNIRDIGEDGCLIIEKASNKNQYEAICLSSEGKEQWRKSVRNEFTAQWDDGKVYMIAYDVGSSTRMTLYAYGYKGDEVFKVEQQIPGVKFHISHYEKDKKPVIKNGKVYVYIEETYAFDIKTGEKLWRVHIRDTYDSSAPFSLTVDDNDVIYTSTGARGMFAYTVNGQSSTGFELSLRGRNVIKYGSMNEISLDIANNTDTKQENVMISLSLKDVSKNEGMTISKLALYKTMDKKSKDICRFLLNIPHDGKYKIEIKAVGQDGKVLDMVELSAGGKER